MQKLRQRGILPYLGVLAGLLILSITAPRAWERVVRRAPVVMDRAGRVTPQNATKPAQVAREEKLRQIPQFVRPSPALPPTKRAEPVTVSTEPTMAAPVARMADPDTLEGVAELAARPRRPEDKPDMAPVAPSLELTLPALPAPEATAEQAPAAETELPQPSLSISIEPALPPAGPPVAANESTAAPVASAPAPRAIVIPAPKEQPRTGAPVPPPALYANSPSIQTPHVAPAPAETPAPSPAAELLLPVALIQRLETVAVSSHCEPWARNVAQRARELTTQTAPGSPEAIALLAELRKASTAADQIAARISDETLSAELRRAQYALMRRLDVWDKIFAAPAATARDAALAKAQAGDTAENLLASVTGVETLLSRATDAKPWRDYLMLDALRDAARQDAEGRRALARRVLSRLDRAKEAARQRQFIDDAAVVALDQELRRWATEPIDPPQLLARLEQYERTGAISDARLVADDRRLLGYSTDGESQELAQKLEEHYRNANVRVVVAGDLINRLLPAQKARQEPVYDTILGTPVEGYSTTSTKLFVRLVPDPQALRLGLEASGVVSSQTTSNAGPATFRNQGQSDYLVRKLVLIGTDGPHVWPAVADANNETELESLDTNYDGLPLVRSLARNIARSQYDQKREEARREVEAKVAATAKARLDAEADPRISKVEAEVRKRFLTPLGKLDLDPSVVSLSTTEKRMVARVRFAGHDQLGANTPRPQAPSDSLASMQVHQTALNNLLDRLQLDGRSFTLPELYQWIATKLGRPAPELPEDLPEDVTITFAEHDAVSVQCRDGQMELTVGIAELVHEQRHFRNFQVRALYRPASERLKLGLERQGSISLAGERLNMKAQVVLRGIFSLALPAGKPIMLVPDDVLADPRLSDFAVTQFVVEDGWIGMAIGPRRIAGRPATEGRNTKY